MGENPVTMMRIVPKSNVEPLTALDIVVRSFHEDMHIFVQCKFCSQYVKFCDPVKGLILLEMYVNYEIPSNIGWHLSYVMHFLFCSCPFPVFIGKSRKLFWEDSYAIIKL